MFKKVVTLYTNLLLKSYFDLCLFNKMVKVRK